jgi:hypothetical protein
MYYFNPARAAAQYQTGRTGLSPHIELRVRGRFSHDFQALKQPLIMLGIGIAGGEELLAIENRIRAGHEAQRLQFIAHLGTACR